MRCCAILAVTIAEELGVLDAGVLALECSSQWNPVANQCSWQCPLNAAAMANCEVRAEKPQSLRERGTCHVRQNRGGGGEVGVVCQGRGVKCCANGSVWPQLSLCPPGSFPIIFLCFDWRREAFSHCSGLCICLLLCGIVRGGLSCRWSAIKSHTAT